LILERLPGGTLETGARRLPAAGFEEASKRP
jgi:hypothetical protein